MIRWLNAGSRGSFVFSQNHLSDHARLQNASQARTHQKRNLSNPKKLLPVFCVPLASFTTAASRCLYAIRAIGGWSCCARQLTTHSRIKVLRTVKKKTGEISSDGRARGTGKSDWDVLRQSRCVDSGRQNPVAVQHPNRFLEHQKCL